jgi:hypothetical protein
MDPNPAHRYKLKTESGSSNSSAADFFVSQFAIYLSLVLLKGSVADPDPGSGAFLTPGSGIRDG